MDVSLQKIDEMDQTHRPGKEHIIDVDGFSWVESSNGEHVVGAIDGGSEPDEMYVGRAYHQYDLIPGNVHCKDGALYVPWGEEFLYMPNWTFVYTFIKT